MPFFQANFDTIFPIKRMDLPNPITGIPLIGNKKVYKQTKKQLS